MAYWLKLIGTSANRIPNAWLGDHLVDGLLQFESASRKDGCPIQKDDFVLIAGSGWSRIVAAVQVDAEPRWGDPPRWGPRWPWELFGRIIAHVEHAESGPRVRDTDVPRSYGPGCLPITADQFKSGLQALKDA